MTDVAVFARADDLIERAMAQWASTLALVVQADPQHTLLCFRRGTAADRATVAADVAGAGAALYFGHGRPHQLGGRTPFVTQSEAPAFHGIAVAAIACHAGAGIGLDLVSRHGARGFLGFDDQLCVYLANPAVFAPVVVDALRAFCDPRSGGKVALDTLSGGFRALRLRYQAAEKDRSLSRRERYAAQMIWLAAYPNEKTAVWISPQGGGVGP